MPMQQTNSSFAQRLGGRVAAANAEHKDKPVDTGNRRLPSGIRSGIAKLSTMYTKQQTEENSKTPKGETFFRASAIVMSPESHDGQKVAGVVTQVVIPICDVPAKGQRKAVSFEENWYDFQNLFKLLGVAAPTGPQYDVTEQMSDAQKAVAGAAVEAYYLAAMQALTNPQRPVYIEFSTRGWTPPATAQQPKPEEMVFETWHGLATYDGKHDPAAGVRSPARTQPDVTSQPPKTKEPFNEFAPQPTKATATSNGQPHQEDNSTEPPVKYGSLAEEVAVLVEVAMNDPEGATADGAAASERLEELAWQAGWSKEQTTGAPNWAAVGEMALVSYSPTMTSRNPTSLAINGVPTVGSKWKFSKRTKEGAKLKNAKGEEFPPQNVEVVEVDDDTKTCVVKNLKDDKIVVDVRSKQPIAVKWEWLE